MTRVEISYDVAPNKGYLCWCHEISWTVDGKLDRQTVGSATHARWVCPVRALRSAHMPIHMSILDTTNFRNRHTYNILSWYTSRLATETALHRIHHCKEIFDDQ